MDIGKSRTGPDRLMIAVIVFLSLYITIFAIPVESKDTLLLIPSAANMLACFRQGIFSSCPGVWHFPLSQFIPSAFFIVLGLSESQILSALTALNLVAFIASVILFYSAGKRWAGKSAGALLAAVLLSGYGLVYSSYSFNEATAFFLIALFAYACLFRWNWSIIFLINVAAGITKEIAPPFLLAMGLLALISNWDKNRIPEQIKFTLILLSGFAISLVVNVAFNFFRYASFQNVQLLAKAFIVPNVRIWIDYFFMLIFSPNGGILWAWTTWCVLCFILTFPALGVQTRQNWQTFAQETLPTLGFVLLFLILHIGLAKWWIPFGWTAWGPRLTLPYLGGLLLILSSSNKRTLSIISQQFLQDRRHAILTGCIIGLFSLPHVLMLIAPDLTNNLFNQYTSLTPALGISPWELNPHGEGDVLARSWSYYYLVVREQAWLTGNIYLTQLSMLRNPTIFLHILPYYLMFPLLFAFAQENTEQLNVVETSWMPLPQRKTLFSWGVLATTAIIAAFVFFHLHPPMDIQLIGPLPFPAALDGRIPRTSNECGFVEFRLTIRKLGLITNISIKQKPDQPLIGSTDLQSGSAPIWVIGHDKPNQLLNTTDGNIRIPIVAPESFLLYNARACNSDQTFQKMEAVITYSDGRILTTIVANATTK